MRRSCPPFPVESLHDVPLFRDFAGLGGWDDLLPDESTILLFRHALEKHKLAERIKASIRAKLEHPFRVIKHQFGHMKVRYRGLAGQ